MYFRYQILTLDKISCENSFLEDIYKSNLPFIDKHLLRLQ
jgi:hypothetical protein